ncbi:hypothetical protein V6N13_048462 [Hibiscus sabdariffa]
MVAYEMIQNLNEIYEGKARQERYETSKAIFQCQMSEGSPVGAHVIKMMGYIQTLEKLGFFLKNELATNVILQSLSDSFKPFVLNFNMNEINKTLPQLLDMLRTAEGKLTKAPFNGKAERTSDLLGLIHSDVCGPMNTQARGGFQYFITFTDDFSRYEYIYLMRHKYEALEKFKEFKNEVENQQATFTLNRVPSKSVQKTPYEIWTGKRPSMSFMKVWGCEAYVKHQMSTKLELKSHKCTFVGYPKKTKGYYFFNPKENKVFVARTGVFLEREFLSKKGDHRNIELKEVQQEQVDEPEVEQVSQVVEGNSTNFETQPLQRSTRERHVHERYGFLITTHVDAILVD